MLSGFARIFCFCILNPVLLMCQLGWTQSSPICFLVQLYRGICVDENFGGIMYRLVICMNVEQHGL